MKISGAIFAGSSTRVSGKPKRKLPEFAFIGRSNVGKSSLINMLTGRRKLAMTSSTPGKTKVVNQEHILPVFLIAFPVPDRRKKLPEKMIVQQLFRAASGVSPVEKIRKIVRHAHCVDTPDIFRAVLPDSRFRFVRQPEPKP